MFHDAIDKNTPSLLRKKRLLGNREEISPEDVKNLVSVLADHDFTYCQQDNVVDGCYLAKYLAKEVFNGCAPLTRQGGTYYLQTANHAFVIKSLNGREMQVDEKVIESLGEEKLDISYVKIAQGKIDVTKEIDSDINGVDELTEMFQKFMRIEDVKIASGK